MLLGGFWFDTKKPTMSTFLYPLISSFDQLHSSGKYNGRLSCVLGGGGVGLATVHMDVHNHGVY